MLPLKERQAERAKRLQATIQSEADNEAVIHAQVQADSARHVAESGEHEAAAAAVAGAAKQVAAKNPFGGKSSAKAK